MPSNSKEYISSYMREYRSGKRRRDAKVKDTLPNTLPVKSAVKDTFHTLPVKDVEDTLRTYVASKIDDAMIERILTKIIINEIQPTLDVLKKEQEVYKKEALSTIDMLKKAVGSVEDFQYQLDRHDSTFKSIQGALSNTGISFTIQR
jgi:hypothetical protein